MFQYTATDEGSGIDRVIVSNSDTPFVTCFSNWCMVIGGTYVQLTAYDKAGTAPRQAQKKTSGATLKS